MTSLIIPVHFQPPFIGGKNKRRPNVAAPFSQLTFWIKFFSPPLDPDNLALLLWPKYHSGSPSISVLGTGKKLSFQKYYICEYLFLNFLENLLTKDIY
jgi:hypothetical protein